MKSEEPNTKKKENSRKMKPIIEEMTKRPIIEEVSKRDKTKSKDTDQVIINITL
jgi:hypothetical protein